MHEITVAEAVTVCDALSKCCSGICSMLLVYKLYDSGLDQIIYVQVTSTLEALYKWIRVTQIIAQVVL